MNKIRSSKSFKKNLRSRIDTQIVVQIEYHLRKESVHLSMRDQNEIATFAIALKSKRKGKTSSLSNSVRFTLFSDNLILVNRLFKLA